MGGGMGYLEPSWRDDAVADGHAGNPGWVTGIAAGNTQQPASGRGVATRRAPTVPVARPKGAGRDLQAAWIQPKVTTPAGTGPGMTGRQEVRRPKGKGNSDRPRTD